MPKRYRFIPAPLFLFTTLTLSLLANEARYGDLVYEEQSDSIRIIDYSLLAEGNLTVPSMIDGKPVTAIGEEAFEGTRVDEVYLPNTLLELEERAFSGSALVVIHIPASVETISATTFEFCWNLNRIEVDPANPNYASVDGVLFNKTMDQLLVVPATKKVFEGYVVPGTVTDIADYAFFESAIEQVTLPDGLLSIGARVFWNASLTSLSIPASTTSIGEGAFLGCRPLISVEVDPSNQSFSSEDGVLFDKAKETLLLYPQSRDAESYSVPDGVIRIDEDAFELSFFLQTLTLPASLAELPVGDLALRGLTSFVVAESSDRFHSIDGVLFSKDGTELVSYPEDKEDNPYAVPEGVTKIGSYAFQRNEKLLSVSLPDGLLEVGDHAFDSCRGLETINLPDSLTRLGDRAFHLCGRLTEVTIPIGVSHLGAGLFERCSSLKSIVVPDGITEIKEGTFEGCRLMETITLPDSIETIGDRAFLGCRFLSEIILPDSVRSIGVSSFSTCQALISITLPEGIETIPAEAFEFCFDLVNIQLPSTIKTIETDAFRLCRSLPELTIPAGVESIGSRAFHECRELAVINVDEGNAHFRSEGGVLFSEDMSRLVRVPTKLEGTSYEVPSLVKRLEPYSFQKCEFNSVSLPLGLQSIGELAFESCAFLSSIEIPDTVSELGHEIFFACSSLKSAVLPDGIQSIPSGTFRRCQILLDVSIPSTVRRLEDRVFSDCTELPGVLLPANLEYIGNYAFERCTQLLEISIPGSVKQIGDYAFRECDHLLEVSFNEGLEIIGDYAFDGCHFLERMEFPQSLRRIEDRAFTDCTGIREFKVSEGLEYIGEFAFVNCWGYEVISLPESLIKIETEAFNGNAGLKYIYFLGDAPEVDEPFPFTNVHNEAAVFFFEGAAGFTSPTWAGLPTMNLGEPKASDVWLIDNQLSHDTDLGILSATSGLPILINYGWDQMIGSTDVPQAKVDGDTLSYDFFGGRSDVTYIVELSKDLTTWTTTGVTLSEPDPEGIRTASLNLDDGRCFVRFRFSIE